MRFRSVRVGIKLKKSVKNEKNNDALKNVVAMMVMTIMMMIMMIMIMIMIIPQNFSSLSSFGP